jgi:hypothetical protein
LHGSKIMLKSKRQRKHMVDGLGCRVLRQRQEAAGLMDCCVVYPMHTSVATKLILDSK